MNDAFYEFCNMVGDPSWVCFACLITGVIFGFGACMVTAAADELYCFFVRVKRLKRVPPQTSVFVDEAGFPIKSASDKEAF